MSVTDTTAEFATMEDARTDTHAEAYSDNGAPDAGQQVQVFTLTREALNKITFTRRYEYVPVHELAPGARARIQSLNSSEISAFEASNYKGVGTKTKLALEDSTARLVAWGWVDEDGKRVFQPRESDDVRRIGLMDNAPVARIAEAIRVLSGMRTPDEDEDGETGKGRTGSD
jgi:hypothetical protein